MQSTNYKLGRRYVWITFENASEKLTILNQEF